MSLQNNIRYELELYFAYQYRISPNEIIKTKELL